MREPPFVLRLTVTGLIAALALSGLLLCYLGVLKLISGSLASAGVQAGAVTLIAIAVAILLHFRDELIDA